MGHIKYNLDEGYKIPVVQKMFVSTLVQCYFSDLSNANVKFCVWLADKSIFLNQIILSLFL